MDKKEEKKDKEKEKSQASSPFAPNVIGMFAEEVAKTVAQRLPGLLQRPQKKNRKKVKKIENSIFLDTSAIIDGRVFDIITLGLIRGSIIVPESILLELKHIADSQDTVKRERGRKGLEMLEKVKKVKGVRLTVLSENDKDDKKKKEVDEKLIEMTKYHKGRVVTCDYNLEKKANIQGVLAININALANCLKVKAVPGEALHINVLHKGKDITQGVGYLDDGTMIVIENASENIGQTLDVVVSRVIQTTAGRILFAKKI